VAGSFGKSKERRAILRGLIGYRSHLRRIGIVDGCQWLDGSFVEDVETLRLTPPGDIDAVTFAPRAVQDINQWMAIFHTNPAVFNPQVAKQQYSVDAYFVDLSIHPRLIIEHVVYWLGVFSHQRDTGTWKGMLEIELGGDDADVMTLLDEADALAAIPDIVAGVAPNA
jgi:hypothetical protein